MGGYRMGESIEVRIEIPRGSRNKYEYDEATGSIWLDRVLYSSVHYPADYGYIPNTRAPDGDHLDVLVLVEEPTFPGCLVRARPIGLLRMEDEKGIDDKVLAVLMDDPRFAEVNDLEQLGQHWLREIENFFRTYKLLEGVETQVFSWEGREKAREVIRQSRQGPTESPPWPQRPPASA
ncbi:MAG: inorganic diphosphatase [Dehalococcoidia bacterium]